MSARDNDGLRAFHEGVSFRALCNKVRSGLLGRGFTLTPQPPKGPRASGPHLGPWHESREQAEMMVRDEELLSAERCAGCGNKVIAASGEMYRPGPFCGKCWNDRQVPPAA